MQNIKLKDNTENLDDFWPSDDLLDLTPKAHRLKEIISKLGFINIFWFLKENKNVNHR